MGAAKDAKWLERNVGKMSEQPFPGSIGSARDKMELKLFRSAVYDAVYIYTRVELIDWFRPRWQLSHRRAGCQKFFAELLPSCLLSSATIVARDPVGL